MTVWAPGLESEPSDSILIETKNLTMGAVSAAEGAVAPIAGTHARLKNTYAQIVAIPAAGYLFDEWTGDSVVDSANRITTVYMDADKSVQATFALKRQLTILSTGGGTTSPGFGIYEYKDDEKVHVSAIPADGYKFKEWQNDASGSSPDITVTMTADKTIVAVFEENVVAADSDLLIALTVDNDDEKVYAIYQGQYIQVGGMNHNRFSNTGTNSHTEIDTHLANTSNPHSVTAAQVGALPLSTGTTLPTASADYRGKFRIVTGSAGPPAVPDKIYYCRSTDDGTTYEWKEIAFI